MRYLPLTDADRRDMLATIGVPSIDACSRDVPEAARHRRACSTCRERMGELEVERRSRRAGGEELGRRVARRSSSAAAPIATTCRPPSTI